MSFFNENDQNRFDITLRDGRQSMTQPNIVLKHKRHPEDALILLLGNLTVKMGCLITIIIIVVGICYK